MWTPAKQISSNMIEVHEKEGGGCFSHEIFLQLKKNQTAYFFDYFMASWMPLLLP